MIVAVAVMPFVSEPGLFTVMPTRITRTPSLEICCAVSTDDTVPLTSLIAEAMDTVADCPVRMLRAYSALNASVSFIWRSFTM